MALTAVYASGSPGNTYVPSFEASGKLAVEFSRNAKDFAINKYVTIVKVDKSTGLFLRITPENAARLTNTNKSIWADGAAAYRYDQAGEDNQESFQFETYTTERRKWDFALGQKAVEQADWDILALHAAMVAQQAMTARTYLGVTALTTSGNYAAAHTATAAVVAGGDLEGGSPTDPRLKKAINYVLKQIRKSTLGVVSGKDIQMVFGPDYADAFSRSQEVHTYLKESPAALAQVRGDVPAQNGQWGLPDMMYGVNFAIEDAVRISTERGQTATPDFVYNQTLDSVAFASRPGSLVSKAGGPNFSTLQCFMYEEMTVESKSDPDNRRHLGRVVEDYGFVMVAPLSGFLITSAVGSF